MGDPAAPLTGAIAHVAPELSGVAVSAEGVLPPLRGTCYFNGPGRFVRNGEQVYRHWFDGDGMVAALRFGSDGISVSSRYVRTRRWCEEEQRGEPVFRAFGTAFSGDVVARGANIVSPANVCVLPFANRLLALGEQGLPYAMDPETLETLGEFDFDGGLHDLCPFGAHAKLDPETGELFNFGVVFSEQQPRLNVYRAEPSGKLTYRRRIKLDRPRVAHDFTLAGRYMVFYLGPHLLDSTALLDGSSVMEALSWKPEIGSRLVVVDKDDGSQRLHVPLEAGACLHLVNGFERDGRVLIDLIELDRPVYDQYEAVPDSFVDAPASRLVRLDVDVDTATVTRYPADEDNLYDFPEIRADLRGRPHRHFWVLGLRNWRAPGSKFFDELTCWDCETQTVTSRFTSDPGTYFCGQPVLMPAANPEDEILLCQAFDADPYASFFLLFRAHDLARGPLARLRTSESLGLFFHTAYSPAAQGS